MSQSDDNVQQELYIDLEQEEAWQWSLWHKQQEEDRQNEKEINDGGTVIVIDMRNGDA